MPLGFVVRLALDRVVRRFAAGLRAPAAEVRVAAEADFARVVDFFAVDDLRVPVERFRLEDLAAAPEAAFFADGASSIHLPDITRSAASATASAINEPNLLALDMAVVAACDAASAASRPASRIARRALGLALIAAAAAASPAASISRLIAALAILSTVDFPELEDDFDELFLVDFAMQTSLSVGKKDTSDA